LRTAISKQPDAVIQTEISHLRAGGQMTPDMVFRDPYMLDFLNLPQRYAERDLEEAILCEMERFLLELGAGFTFVARQKRISVGADDFYLDLLPPPSAPLGGGGVEVGKISACPQRPNGTVPALAG